MVFCCGGGLFSAPEVVQREKVGKIGKRLLWVSEGAISWLVRASLPWCGMEKEVLGAVRPSGSGCVSVAKTLHVSACEVQKGAAAAVTVGNKC